MMSRCVLILFTLCIYLVSCNIDASENVAIVEHWVENSWVPRGKIHLALNHAEYLQNSYNVDKDLNYIASLSQQDQFYKFRLKCVDSALSTYYVQSYLKACMFVEAGFTETLFLTLTPTRQIISVHSKLPVSGNCAGASVLQQPEGFNTSVQYIQSVAGPSPDTQSFVDRIEKEKIEKEKNPTDNRSFLQKYWMYILPAVLILYMNAGGAGTAGR